MSMRSGHLLARHPLVAQPLLEQLPAPASRASATHRNVLEDHLRSSPRRDLDLAAVASVESDSDPQRCRLPTAALADQRKRSARLDLERNVADGDEAAECLGQPATRQARLELATVPAASRLRRPASGCSP